MKPIAKLYMLTIIFSIIFDIFIFHIPKVIAEDNDWLSVGNLLKQQGNYTGAIAAYTKALEIDPNYVNAWDGKGWALNELGNYTQAISYFNKALGIDPNYKWSLSNKGWALNELGNYTQAIFYLNKVLEMDSKHVDALIFKGQSLYGLGNHTGAKYYFDSAFELDPSNKLLKRIYNNSTKEYINSNRQNNLIFITFSIIRYGNAFEYTCSKIIV